MRRLRGSVVLLLWSACGLLMALALDSESFWKVSGNVGTSFEQIACARKCDAERAKVCVVLEPDGTCSCDKCYKNIAANTYMARQGRSSVPEISSIFLPFTSSANNFESLGTENVPVTVVGSPMQFTEDGPNGFPEEQKALHLDTSSTRYLKYSIPQSLIDSALGEGFIISFWVEFKSVTQEPIWEFFSGFLGTRGMNFWQFPANSVSLMMDGNTQAIKTETSPGWHHCVITLDRKTEKIELFQDGVSGGTAVFLPGLKRELYFGHGPGYPASTSSGVLCFVMQIVGQKSPDEINAAIEMAKNACHTI